MISLSLFLDLNVFLLHILVACIANKMQLSLLHNSFFFGQIVSCQIRAPNS
ncbi:hypothetical protein PVAP13_9KG583826 [Panicum virgatum]|uniref:Uncharacterized protein n=1 Tax=Panicum virgatum TaxID=38727 RepID=A0A8T0NVY0_PANVG|nr:hypothetical protein PVAP13_9KG583826 [Panicum virgatum]